METFALSSDNIKNIYQILKSFKKEHGFSIYSKSLIINANNGCIIFCDLSPIIPDDINIAISNIPEFLNFLDSFIHDDLDVNISIDMKKYELYNDKTAVSLMSTSIKTDKSYFDTISNIISGINVSNPITLNKTFRSNKIQSILDKEEFCIFNLNNNDINAISIGASYKTSIDDTNVKTVSFDTAIKSRSILRFSQDDSILTLKTFNNKHYLTLQYDLHNFKTTIIENVLIVNNKEKLAHDF